MEKKKDKKQVEAIARLTDEECLKLYEAVIEKSNKKPFGWFLASMASGQGTTASEPSSETPSEYSARWQKTLERHLLPKKVSALRGENESLKTMVTALKARIDAMEQDNSATKPAAVLKRVSDEVICARNGRRTEEFIKADYKPLLHELQEVRRFIDDKYIVEAQIPTAAEVIAAFTGKALYLFGTGRKTGYATERDIERFLRSTLPPYEFTRELMAGVHRVSRATVHDYVKPSRKNKRKN